MKHDKIEQITNDVLHRFKKLLQERAELITEKWSISEDVIDASDKLLHDIKKQLINFTFQNCANGIDLGQGLIKNYNLFKENISIQVYVYNCSSVELAKFAYDKLANLNGFIAERNELNLTLYLVNWDYVNGLNNSVSHEIEHLYQMHLGKTKNVNYTELMNQMYHQAVEIMSHSNHYSQEVLHIAQLIYYGNPHEQDAFIQEFAREVYKNPFATNNKSSEIYLILNNYKRYIDTYIQNKNTIQYKNALKIFRASGVTERNFDVMINKALRRLERKIKNVEKNCLEDCSKFRMR